MNNPPELTMQRQTRPSHLVQQQLDAFLASLPTNLSAPPPNDFAAALEWESWQQHIRELQSELVASQAAEEAL